MINSNRTEIEIMLHLTRKPSNALVLEEGGYEDGLNVVLHHLGDALVDPHRYVGQNTPETDCFDKNKLYLPAKTQDKSFMCFYC